MPHTRVYLLRHGATALNRHVPYRLQGQRSDPPLDELGVEQARAAAEALRHLKFDAVYTSPLQRAVMTARRLGDPQLVQALIEGDIGRWEGMTWDEAARADPDHHAQFLNRPGTTPYPDGESFLDVQLRVVPAVRDLVRAHLGGRIAVVGHNILNRAYLAHVMGLPIDQARAIRLANCGISVVEYDQDQPTLITLNSALHLEAIARS